MVSDLHAPCQVMVSSFRTILCVVFISFLAPPHSYGKSAVQPKSVYRVSGTGDGIAIGVASLAYLLPTAFSSDLITRKCPCPPSEVNPVDRSVIGNDSQFLSSLSDVTVAAAVVTPVFLDWNHLGFTRAFWEDMVVYTEVFMVNGALTSLAKYAAQRPLPKVYAENDSGLASEPGGFRSFYSGHASTAFSSLSAASMTYYFRHGSSSWPWIITAAVGTSVMIERVAAGRHFYSDVLFGALAGIGVGTFIPMLHYRSPDSNFEVKPIASADRLGVSWEWRI